MLAPCARTARRSQLRNGYLKSGHAPYFNVKGNSADLPLRLREQEPHEDTDRHRKSAVYEAGFDIEREEHGRSCVATKN